MRAYSVCMMVDTASSLECSSFDPGSGGTYVGRQAGAGRHRQAGRKTQAGRQAGRQTGTG
jgi:hypothetical protein